MESFLQLLLVIVLILLNSFFVASEFALVAVRRTRIQELVKKGRKRAKLVDKALKSLDVYISATQLGITIASLALGWVGEPALSHIFAPIFEFLPHGNQFISQHTISALISFSIITFLHIVIGEISPKTIALQKAETVSLFIIVPLLAFSHIFKPFIWLLNESGNIVVKILGLHGSNSHPLAHSEEEIKLIINQSQKEGVIEKEEVQMVHNVFKMADQQISKIMIPKKEIISFSINSSLQLVSAEMEKHPFSRFPVYDKNPDSIIGFVHVKDIFKAVLSHHTHNEVLLKSLSLIRKILLIKEKTKLDDALNIMRARHIHVCMVVNQNKKIIGMATLEDIVESVVGEIEDEFD